MMKSGPEAVKGPRTDLLASKLPTKEPFTKILPATPVSFKRSDLD